MDTIVKAFLRYISEARCFFFLLFDSFCYLIPRQRNTRFKKQVLIIKLDGIGDFILWLDAAKELKKLYPHDKYEITLLSNKLWSSFAEKLPYFDAVWPVDLRKFMHNLPYRIACLMKVRKAGFDIVVQPTYSRIILHGDAIVRVSGAGDRIGSQGDTTNMGSLQKRISDRWYTRLLPATGEPIMELVRNAEFMRELGLPGFRADVPSIHVDSLLPAELEGKRYFILFPGAGAIYRQWPISNFAELAGKIYEATGWPGIICGSPDEQPLGDILKRKTRAVLHNWCGKTSLEELIAIIGGCQMMIENETSAVHIAAAVGAPSVCILGGGHFGRFVPYRAEVETKKLPPLVVFQHRSCSGCNWQCIHSTGKYEVAPCIADISVEDVWETTKALLQNT